MDTERIEEFQTTVWRYYDQHGRHNLPWRLADRDGQFDPYKIMVSEIMLQQTQVSRVMPKYLDFIKRFPTIKDLAGTSLAEVLMAWQGLGYNRRAKFLWQAAQHIMERHKGVFPRTVPELVSLPGIGTNTAGAIMAYAYDQPAVFVETNIRSIYIHYFFRGETSVSDKAVLELVHDSLPIDSNYRNWYWALMDYGVYLKQTVGNSARASKTYVRQAPFEGSRRQVRGAVIRVLGQTHSDDTHTGYDQAALQLSIPDPRLSEVIEDLVREELICYDGQSKRYRLA